MGITFLDIICINTLYSLFKTQNATMQNPNTELKREKTQNAKYKEETLNQNRRFKTQNAKYDMCFKPY